MEIYYAQPILNPHRHSKRIEVSLEPVHPKNERLFAKAKEELSKAKLEYNPEKLVLPEISVALGRERSFAPPLASRNYEFVEAVLAHCADLDTKVAEHIRSCAVELEAKSLYVLPKDYRPMTNIGPITAERAEELRTGPCQRRELKKTHGKSPSNADPTHGHDARKDVEDWEQTWSIELLYREYVQLICSMRADGPFILYMTKWVEVGGRRVDLGSMYLPFLYFEQKPIR